MVDLINAITNVAFKLKEYDDAKPDISITNHHFSTFNDFKFTGSDVSIINLSTSSFSLESVKLNGIVCLLSPYIWRREDGRGVVRAFKSEIRRPRRAIPSNSLLLKECIAFPKYLRPLEEIRGSVFWDIDSDNLNEFLLSAKISSKESEISALMRI